MGIQKIAMTLVVALTATMSAQAAQLSCYSGKNAQAYMNTTGQWRIKADVQSPYTLKNLEIKNLRKSTLGSMTALARYDKRITDARLFETKPDVFCNYELVMPRDFKTQKKFVADLIMTCDDMYDGKATMYCNVK